MNLQFLNHLKEEEEEEELDDVEALKEKDEIIIEDDDDDVIAGGPPLRAISRHSSTSSLAGDTLVWFNPLSTGAQFCDENVSKII